MATIYQMSVEADYDAMSKNTQAGQAQSWDSSSALGGVAGDVKLVIAGGNTNTVSARKTPISVGSATTIAGRIYFDTSSFTQTTNNGLTGLFTINAPGFNVVSFGSRLSSGNYQVLYQSLLDSGGGSASNVAVNTTQGEHYIGFVLRKAATASSNDGSVTYYLDGAQVGERTGMDIFDAFAALNLIDIGPSAAFSPPSSGASGTLWVGKLLVTNDADPIGPFLSYRHRPRPAAIMKKRQRIKGYRCG